RGLQQALGPGSRLQSCTSHATNALAILEEPRTLNRELRTESPMQIITAPIAPAAVGPYSQAVRTGNLLFCSGQIPINPATGKIEATDVEGQAHQVIANIKAV